MSASRCIRARNTALSEYCGEINFSATTRCLRVSSAS
ncbi:Uncharacterised protein [Mycobacterium tuberculosis]|uniref:Uncharacterized protein n=1 Tax=Mycobacterium tuberculosis TaxID=1773 RepID=A0A0U0QI93_MYCTX|nr:Uncharacterised protein [Mycobacterium tuberculosis]COU92237.1 Uncharacterised protein [Mycobacterium tuberculosis]COZ63629.1 Uncharacterised protein [Mycobacterium tuberculosis]